MVVSVEFWHFLEVVEHVVGHSVPARNSVCPRLLHEEQLVGEGVQIVSIVLKRKTRDDNNWFYSLTMISLSNWLYVWNNWFILILHVCEKSTSLIVGSQEKASMKIGSSNFCEIFKNTNKQLRTIFSKTLMSRKFYSGTHLDLEDPPGSRSQTHVQTLGVASHPDLDPNCIVAPRV